MAAIFGAGATFPSRPIILGIYVKFRGCIQSSSIPSKEFRVWKSTGDSIGKSWQIALHIVISSLEPHPVVKLMVIFFEIPVYYYHYYYYHYYIHIIIIVIIYCYFHYFFLGGGSQKAECECSKTKPPFQITTTPKFHISIFWSSNLRPCYCAGLLLGGVIGMPCSKLMAISTIPILQLLGS